MNLVVHTFLNGAFEENCYLVHAQGAKTGFLIDPGTSPKELQAGTDQAGVKPDWVLATHGHIDHVGVVAAMKEAYGAKFAMAQEDEMHLEGLEDSFAFYGFGKTKRPQVERFLKDGDELEAGGLKLKVIATPGHSAGSLCFYHAESGTLFSGDTLFRRSVGRYDFEGGSRQALMDSITKRLYALPDATKVYPGHGEPTTIGEEKKENPFVAQD